MTELTEYETAVIALFRDGNPSDDQWRELGIAAQWIAERRPTAGTGKKTTIITAYVATRISHFRDGDPSDEQWQDVARVIEWVSKGPFAMEVVAIDEELFTKAEPRIDTHEHRSNPCPSGNGSKSMKVMTEYKIAVIKLFRDKNPTADQWREMAFAVEWLSKSPLMADVSTINEEILGEPGPGVIK